MNQAEKTPTCETVAYGLNHYCFCIFTVFYFQVTLFAFQVHFPLLQVRIALVQVTLPYFQVRILFLGVTFSCLGALSPFVGATSSGLGVTFLLLGAGPFCTFYAIPPNLSTTKKISHHRRYAHVVAYLSHQVTVSKIVEHIVINRQIYSLQLLVLDHFQSLSYLL